MQGRSLLLFWLLICAGCRATTEGALEPSAALRPRLVLAIVSGPTLGSGAGSDHARERFSEAITALTTMTGGGSGLRSLKLDSAVLLGPLTQPGSGHPAREDLRDAAALLPSSLLAPRPEAEGWEDLPAGVTIAGVAGARPALWIGRLEAGAVAGPPGQTAADASWRIGVSSGAPAPAELKERPLLDLLITPSDRFELRPGAPPTLGVPPLTGAAPTLTAIELSQDGLRAQRYTLRPGLEPTAIGPALQGPLVRRP